jgi:sirohydrochlorin ferrochelatase
MTTNALLLAGHGSLRPASGAAMIRLAARLREGGAAPLVAAGFLNYSRPTLADTLARLVARGATAVTVLPYFLVPGYFTCVALPRALDGLRALHPGLSLAQAEPLGAHPALAELARRRAEAAGATGASAVLLAAHGSPDPAANAPILVVAEQLRAMDRFAAVTVCYLGLNEPSIPEAIAAHGLAGFRRLVVVPYLLQLGGHAAEDIPAAVEAARALHPALAIGLAGHLGYDPLLAEALAARAAAIHFNS